jgi:hypothetical protein
MRLPLLGLLLIWIVGSCRKADPPELCFYHWKGQLSFDAADSLEASRMGVSGLYVRFFDVDWDELHGGPVPISVVSGRAEDFCFQGPVVPVVFLTNTCFLRSDSAGCAALAQKVADGIRRLSAQRFGGRPTFREWQIDCDWTPKSRAQFFFFLEKLQSLSDGIPLTCTVRLHQYRDRAANGVPPVDRGLLMCYNVAEATDPGTPNAVFDPALIRGYLQAPPYPIGLDIALPIFSWGALFRDGRFVDLLSPLPRDPSLLSPEEGFWYRVRRDTVLQGQLLRKGDRLRADRADLTALEEVSQWLAEKNLGPQKIIFYHWDKSLIADYETHGILRIYRHFM